MLLSFLGTGGGYTNFSIASYIITFLYILQDLNRDYVLRDIAGKPMNAIDVFSISIKYFKDCLIRYIASIVAHREIGENEIDFVFTVPPILGNEGILFFREAAIKVSYLYKTSYII